MLKSPYYRKSQFTLQAETRDAQIPLFLRPSTKIWVGVLNKILFKKTHPLYPHSAQTELHTHTAQAELHTHTQPRQSSTHTHSPDRAPHTHTAQTKVSTFKSKGQH